MSRARTSPSSIATDYATTYAQSNALYQTAQTVLPGGVTHMARSFDPFPLYIDRCLGPHKWDVDDNQYINYWMGHGSMLLGHAHPAVVDAVQTQVSRGTHAGGNTRLEMEWATRRNTRLIFDEVVTGFRYAVGGCQEYFDIMPGLNHTGQSDGWRPHGGAVAGPHEIVQIFEPKADA